MTPTESLWYSADLPQNATFQREIHRWSTFRQDLKDKPLIKPLVFSNSSYVSVNNASPFSLYSTIAVLFHCFRRLKAEKDRSHGTDPIGMVSRMWKISRMFGQ
jgi:hypothetical protein